MPVVMGTAGHIDHGKTTLVKRLTGIDCDRLEEEHRRGITIELGFAFMPLPDGNRLSIVDVPGHERFVHTMMSGASGIDFVVLVIAADEGVMPQTREHLEICTLLGIKRGIVALTKVDMVDEDLLEMAKEDVASFLQGTFLEGAPIFPVSAHTGEGMDALKDALVTIEKNLVPQRRTDLFRLPVDRVFTMKGHGTVVTGTMVSGSIAVGNEVMLYPSMQESKVRSLQSHGQATDLAPAGRRTAVNLQGLAVEDIERGEVLSCKGSLVASNRWIVELTCLASSPRALRHRKEVHFHHGAKAVQARLYFPLCESLAPGDTALCEVRFSSPMVGVFDDRCVVRSFSPLRTVAGATLIHPLGVDLRKASPLFAERCKQLQALAATTTQNQSLCNGAENATAKSKDKSAEEARVVAAVNLAENTGVTFAELCIITNIDSKGLEKLIAAMSGKQLIYCVDKDERRYFSHAAISQLEADILAFFAAHHAANPMKAGASRTEVQSGFGKKLAPKLMHFLMERLGKTAKLTVSGDVYHLPEHKVSLRQDQTALRGKLLHAHTSAGITPPNLKDVLESLGVTLKDVSALLKVMQDEGELTKVADGMWYATKELKGIEGKVIAWFDTHDNLDVAGLKEITQLSRKYLIALLEYFDREKVTIRVGDKRLLRK